MNREIINNIINEEINKVITEDSNRELARLIRRFLGKKNKKDNDEPQRAPKKREHGEKPKKRDPHEKFMKKLRKLAKGGSAFYDYDTYQRFNGKISAGDATLIRNIIDTEKTNMAAIARILFPDHTDEGAQSQFRKIINGERPFTKRVATKIEKLIAGGQIAIK